jgi:hypothetical protein
MYIVLYSTGSYDDYCKVPVFVTDDKEKADKYVEKFNRIYDKWSTYYSENRDEPFINLEHSVIENIFYFSDLGKAFINEIEFR